MKVALSTSQQGFTLIEVLFASIIVAFIIAGTMASYVASVRMSQRSNMVTATEGETQTAQLLERIRNSVAADDTFFATKAGAGWQSDIAVSGTGSTHNLSTDGQDVQSQYMVTAQDCDGDGVTGDCYSVTARTAWTPAQ